jgi:hypothetical protein
LYSPPRAGCFHSAAGVRGDGLLRPDIALPQDPYRDDAQAAALLAGLR